MSPVPSIASASALSPATPSVSLIANSGGQSASVLSQHLLGTGGLLFAMVAIVSVVGYFYHGRGAAHTTRTNSPWISLGGLLPPMRNRNQTTTNTAAATDWSVDLEAGSEHHVSMVYAKFFHPTFWNLVECHPATLSAPAIHVEEEATENPVPEPQSLGKSSFLTMDDDDDDLNGDDSAKPTRKKPDRDDGLRVKECPPYDTSSPTSVNFSSEIIGTTARPDAFLSVPGERERDPNQDSPSNSDQAFCCECCDRHLAVDPDGDFNCSPYDGIVITDSEAGFPCSAPGGMVTTGPDADFSCPPYDGIIANDSDADFCSPCDGIVTTVSELDTSDLPYISGVTTPSRLSSRTRRYGVADMGSFARDLKETIDSFPSVPTTSRRFGVLNTPKFAEMDPTLSGGSFGRWQFTDEATISYCDIDPYNGHEDFEDCDRSLKDTIPKEGYALVATISPPVGLSDLSKLADMNPTSFRGPLASLGNVDDKQTGLCRGAGVYDSRESAEDGSSDAEIVAALREGQDLMRKLLAELRDPNMDCTPRPLSDDGESEHYGDDADEESSITPLRSAQRLHNARRKSPDSTSSPGTDSDVSAEGSISPLTPPPKQARFLPCAPDLANVHSSPVTVDINEVFVPSTISNSLVMFPIKAHVCDHRDSRSLLYSSWVPLVNLPRL